MATATATAPSLQAGPAIIPPEGSQQANMETLRTFLRLTFDNFFTRSGPVLLAALAAFLFMRFSGVDPTEIDALAAFLWTHRVRIAAISFVAFLAGIFYSLSRPRRVALVDFSMYRPPNELELTVEQAKAFAYRLGCFDEKSIAFQEKVLERSGLGERTSLPPAHHMDPPAPTMANARKEAEMVLFSTLDNLFAKTGVKPKDISVLVVNCSLFCPTPSLSAMIVNKYHMKPDIQSYSLGGMGCSAGLISIKLARDLLQVHKGLAVVVSTENITQNLYLGNKRSMQVSNCLFRMGGAAVLLSSRPKDFGRAKYELVELERTHMGADDKNFKCVVQEEDDQGIVGVSLAKELMQVAGNALKQNITKLGPRVLPLSEQLMFALSLLARKFLGMKVPAYVPDFKTAFEHFCIHAGGRGVLDEISKGLTLNPWYMEASRMALYRFGNTSSASVWYELSYLEAKGRVKRGDRVWQIAFGSGFKCNSAVWRALRDVDAKKNVGPWEDCIQQMPMDVPDLSGM